MGNRHWALLFFVFICFTFSEGLIHHLKIRDDTRGSFFIENFGFLADGVLSVNLTDFKNPKGSSLLNRHGIVIKRSQTNYQRFLSDHPESECLLDEKLEPYEKVITIPSSGEVEDILLISPDGEGFYSIYFVSCGAGNAEISFDMELILRNPGPNYLSAGEQQLPIVYGVFTFFYVIIIAYWIWYYMLPGEGRNVLKIHYLMTITALLKLGSLFFHSIELHFLAQVGHPGGWTWVYLVFSLLKGVMFFFVIALIGTGWAFIKPYLTERDRNVLLIVIPLQVISNAALIYVEETSPGSQEWFTLYDIFRLVDIICCVAILVPIMGSIKHLQEAAQVDGKAARNVAKLRLFREFYMLVVSYVYFTRIIVFLLDSTLLFEWVWISTFVSEVCTIAFFGATGYYFRPVVDNPYLKHDEDEDDEKL